MAEDKKSPSPAYVSYATFKNAVKGLKQSHNHLPDRIDRSLFASMSGSALNQLFGAFKYFSLVDDKGTPSDRLKHLATSDEDGWNKAMRALVEDRYKDQVKLLKTGTPQTLRESFGEIGGIVKPAVRFLLAACKDTGIEVSPLIARDGTKGNGSPRKRKTRDSETGGAGVALPVGNSPSAGGGFAMALLQKFPSFDPNWQPAQQTAWFEAYQKLLELDKKPQE